MSGPWIIAFCALVVLVLVLGGLVLGMLARVDRVLDEIDARTPRHRDHVGGLEVGQELPLREFTSPDLSGPVRFDRAIVVFAAQGCAPCEALMADLAGRAAATDEWRRVLVWDGDRQPPVPEPPGWLVVKEQAAALRRLFEVRGTPFGIVADQAGRVAATGIPNTATDIDKLLETARDRGMSPQRSEADQGLDARQAVARSS
jgi:hypothetical protein